MRDFCSAVPTQSDVTVKLRPVSKKVPLRLSSLATLLSSGQLTPSPLTSPLQVTAAKLSLTLTSELLREGKPSDSDMLSQVQGRGMSQGWLVLVTVLSC